MAKDDYHVLMAKILVRTIKSIAHMKSIGNHPVLLLCGKASGGRNELEKRNSGMDDRGGNRIYCGIPDLYAVDGYGLDAIKRTVHTIRLARTEATAVERTPVKKPFQKPTRCSCLR